MSIVNSPQAPGVLGKPVEVNEFDRYLSALSEWLKNRLAELEALDAAVQQSRHADDLTRDITLGLQLWQSISTRCQRLVLVWNGGRVMGKEREQLSSIIWGRLDDGSWDGSVTSGLSLPEACRMSDALTGQLSAQLQLDPVGTESVGRVRSLMATMERLRDQFLLEPSTNAAASQSRLAQMEARLQAVSDKDGRGGDIGGLLGPLEADVAIFERDLIVASAQRRQNAASPQVCAERDYAQRLRADLVSRSQRLDELVAQVVAVVADPPKYAVPDVSSLGPVPSSDPVELAKYIERLHKVDQALDFVAEKYSDALRASRSLANELTMIRAETQRQHIDNAQMDDLLNVADQLAQMSPQPAEALVTLVQACRQYLSWLETSGRAQDKLDR